MASNFDKFLIVTHFILEFVFVCAAIFATAIGSICVGGFTRHSLDWCPDQEPSVMLIVFGTMCTCFYIFYCMRILVQTHVIGVYDQV